MLPQRESEESPGLHRSRIQEKKTVHRISPEEKIPLKESTGIRMKEEPEAIAPVHAAFGGLTREMQERVVMDIPGTGRIRQQRDFRRH